MSRRLRLKYALHASVLASGFAALPALATPPATVASTPTDTPNDTTQTTEPEAGQTPSQGMLGTLQRSGYLLGDLGGLRTALGDAGMTLNIVETSEILGNVSGGMKQGFVYDGLTQADLQLDTQRAFGLYGGTFNVSALYIHGSNLSQDNLAAIQTASGIEADRSLRLWELWYQQKFDDGKIDVKIGEQSADQEFIVSSNAGLFVNTMFGWPVLPSYDLPGGGPAYPLAASAVRVRFRPSNSLTILAAAFNGVLAFAELQYEFPPNGGMVRPSDTTVLPGVYKLGAWYDSQNFADQQFDTNGLPLASSVSNGNPLQHRGTFSVYAVGDQVIWRSGEEAEQTLSAFTRIMGAPPDENFISLGLNAGLTLKDPIEGRDDDTAGIGMGFAKVSDRTADADRDVALFSGGTPSFVRSSETFVEATYQIQVFPWWQVQPDFQYIFNPGGGIANPNDPLHKIGNEAVLGVRTNITF